MYANLIQCNTAVFDQVQYNVIVFDTIQLHLVQYIHSGHFYSASLSPLLLRGYCIRVSRRSASRSVLSTVQLYLI